MWAFSQRNSKIIHNIQHKNTPESTSRELSKGKGFLEAQHDLKASIANVQRKIDEANDIVGILRCERDQQTQDLLLGYINWLPRTAHKVRDQVILNLLERLKGVDANQKGEALRTSEKKELIEKFEALSASLDTAKTERDEATALIDNLRGDLRNLHEQLAQEQAKSAELDAAVHSHFVDLNDQKTLYAELSAAKNGIQEKYDRVMPAYAEIMRKLPEQKERRDGVRTWVSQLEQALEEHNIDTQTATARATKAEAAAANLQQQVETLTQNADVAKEEYEYEIQRFTQKLDDLWKKYEENNGHRNEQIRLSRNKYETKVKRLKGEVEQSKQKCEADIRRLTDQAEKCRERCRLTSSRFVRRNRSCQLPKTG